MMIIEIIEELIDEAVTELKEGWDAAVQATEELLDSIGEFLFPQNEEDNYD